MNAANRHDHDSAAWTFAVPQHAEMMASMNGLMSAWMARRQEALTTGLQALQKMAASPDPAAAGRVCADWMGGSLNRIAADLAEARAHAAKMAELSQRSWQTVSNQAAATMVAVAEQAHAATPFQPTAVEPPLRKAA